MASSFLSEHTKMSFKGEKLAKLGSQDIAKNFAKGSFLVAVLLTVPLWYCFSNSYFSTDKDLCAAVQKMNNCQFGACIPIQKGNEKNIPAPGRIKNFLHYPTLYRFDLIGKDIPNWDILLYFREMPFFVDKKNTNSFQFFNTVLNISNEYIMVKLERLQLTPTNTIAKHGLKIETTESRIVRSLQYSRVWRIFLRNLPGTKKDLRLGLYDDVKMMYSNSNITESIFDFVAPNFHKTESRVVGKENSEKLGLNLLRHT